MLGFAPLASTPLADDGAGRIVAATGTISASAAAWAAGEALWGQVAAIRAASDTIEAMDPIPSDFAADSYWP